MSRSSASINKIDLPAAQPDVVGEEIEHVLGIRKNECFRISGKSGIGVAELLEAVVTLLPPPEDRADEPTAALIFDSMYDEYRGVICYVRVFAGCLQAQAEDPADGRRPHLYHHRAGQVHARR